MSSPKTTRQQQPQSTPSRRKNETIMKYLMKKKAAVDNNKDRQEDNKEENVIIKEDNNGKATSNENNKFNNKTTAAPEDVKLTFVPVCRPGVNKSVKENIRAFQLMGRGGECRFGSGSCAEHNVKLCRQVEHKRVGCVDKDGKTTWRMREVVTLACPARVHQSSRTSLELSVNENLAGTNKKLRFENNFDDNVKYQPQPEVQIEELRQQTPLDQT